MANEFSVGQLNEYANKLLTQNEILKNVAVKGEISNYIHHSSGHRYFSLKDSEGVISCAMFSFSGNSLTFKPQNGSKVIACGYVGVYKKDGRYQLYVKSMTQDGMGNLFEQFEKLKQKLLAQGLFDQSHKKALPTIPKRIGIVTSHQGAAVQDMLNIIFRRYKNADVLIVPAKVQGVDAYKDVISGITYLNQQPDIDVIIIGRGGGSIEDLWAFNEEELAHCIFNSKVPIISAVGHETDFTIADFVADLRAPTPSAAAELCVPIYDDIENFLDHKTDQLNANIKKVISNNQNKLNLYKTTMLRFNPKNAIDQNRQLVDTIENTLNVKIMATLTRKQNVLKNLSASLSALNPNSVLNRGYAIIKSNTGQVLDSYKNLKPNDKINIILKDGEKSATID